jgi:serine/threonine-protein kinase
MHGLPSGLRAAVDDMRRAVNLDRSAVAIPVIAVYEALALWFIRPRGDGVERIWRERVFATYVWLLAAIAVVGVIVLVVRERRARRWVGEILSAAILVGAVAISHHSHQVGFAITPYVIAIAVTMTTFRTHVAFTVGLHVVALAAMWASIFSASMPAVVQQRVALNTAVVAIFGFVLSRMLYRSFVREMVARRELETLNTSLEDRVTAQIAEISARAHEVETLNQSLRERVRDRSHELGLALARLAASELGESTLPTGRVLAGRYEIVRPIGVGGMGVVYEGRDRQGDSSVAIKLVRSAGRLELLQRFLVEARAAAEIDHPAIVRVWHVDVSPQGELFQVLELLDGRSLEAALAEHRLLNVAAVVRLGELVAGGLAAAHALGIVHRDIKPANIMLTGVTPGVKVLDFGLAKLRRQPDVVATEGGVLMGTPGFLAPEQITTPDHIEGAVDVYSLGATLYQCLAGRAPFVAETAMKMMHSHVYEAPPELAARMPAAPPALCELIMSCLAKEPTARPTAQDVATRLAEIGQAHALPAWSALLEIGGDDATRRLRVAPTLAGPTERFEGDQSGVGPAQP